MAANLAGLMDQYVQTLKALGAIESAAVERAFRRVPRHLLIPRVYTGRREQPEFTEIDPSNPEHLAMIYTDQALLIHWPEPSSSSQPSLMAQMLELLEPRPGMRVLEIGAGSGYNAALMAELVGDAALVTAVDIQADVVEQAR